MAETSTICVQVESELKEEAEKILDQLGISISDAVGMFIRQVVLCRGLPFQVRIPTQESPDRP